MASTALASATTQVPTSASSGVTVRLFTPLGVMPEFGFLPVRVFVDNQSPRDGTWRVRFQAGNADASTGALVNQFEVTVASGTTRDAWTFVPLPDAAPSFTLEPVPASRRNVPIPSRQVTTAVIAESPTVSGLETRIRGKFHLPSGIRMPTGGLRWSARIEDGDRPGEKIGVATTSMSISSDAAPLSGADLPLGFDVVDEQTGSGRIRRFVYKETMIDPTVGAAPRASAWSSFSSSLTAESAARRALDATGLLALPDGVAQTVAVVPLATGVAGDPVAWLTVFTQSGSSRLLPESNGLPLPPGAIVNLHESNREGEVIRTVSFVEPAALLALRQEAESAPAERSDDVAAAEARDSLLRYGFLQETPGVVISRQFPGNPNFTPPLLHQGAVVWFESGPAGLLPKPLFGSLPPDTSVYLRPGPTPDTVVRCFAVGPRAHTTGESPAAGRAASAPAEFRMTVTGPGIVGAAEATFDGLAPGTPSLALPVAVTSKLAPLLRRAFLLGRLRGTANITPLEIEGSPADWRFWSPYQAVLMRQFEYDDLNSDEHAALLSWIRQGGLLYLEPTVYDDTGLGPLEPRVPLDVKREGLGRITRLPYTLDDYDAPEDMNLDGSLWIKPAGPTDLIALMLLHTPATTIPQREFLRQPPPPGGGTSGSGWWAVLLLAAFAILAGPVNIFFFAPTGNRHRLFVTTPLLAVGFTGAFIAGVILWGGLGGNGRREVVVVSQPDAGDAVIFQDQIARTSILGSRRFDVSDATLLTNLSVDDYDSTGRSSILERGGNQASGDWFRNHWATAQHLRALAATDGKVDVRFGAGGGAPVADSTFAATLHDFVYVDALGRSWSTEALPTGRDVTLEASAAIPTWPPLLPAASKYLENMLDRAARLEPGRWIAHGDSSRLAPLTTLAAITWKDDVIYTGLVGAGSPLELPQLTPQPPIVSDNP